MEKGILTTQDAHRRISKSENCPYCNRSSFRDGLTSWTAPGSLAAFSAATAAPAVGVFAAIAVSVAGASAPPAAFVLHSPSVYPDSGAPGPAAAGVCLVPVAAS